MSTIDANTPLGVAVTEAIQKGDLESLQRLLGEHPELATARLRDECDTEALMCLLVR